LAESLECVKALTSQGFVGTVCTPHILRSIYPENTPANVRIAVEEMAEELGSRNLEYQLWSGGEVRIAENTLGWLQEIGVPTLGDSLHVLIDYFGRTWPKSGDAVCEYLLENGYQPLLAHPERMSVPPVEWFRVLDRLTERGVQLQGNLNSLTGNEGGQAQDVAVELLKQDRYFVLAMDMHGVDGLGDRYRGLEIAETLVGLERVRLLTEQRPEAILTQL
jgi:protein-tyrosine phosphatase